MKSGQSYFIVVLLLLLLPLCLTGNTVTSSSSQLVEYWFPYEVCTNTASSLISFSPTSSFKNYLGSLQGSTPVALDRQYLCGYSNGINGNIAALQSTQNVTKLLSALSASTPDSNVDEQLSLSFWYRPSANLTSANIIFSIDNPTKTKSYQYSCTESLLLQQLPTEDHQFRLQVKLCNTDAGTGDAFMTKAIPIPDLLRPSVSLIVINLHSKVVQVGRQPKFTSREVSFNYTVLSFGREAVVGEEYFMHFGSSLLYNSWNKAGFVNIFPKSNANLELNSGKLYALSIGKNSLLQAEIVSLFNNGLLKSPAVAFDRSIIVRENGERIDHTLSDPWFYEQSEIALKDLVVLSLPLYDFEQDNISVNFDLYSKQPSQAFISVTSLKQSWRGIIYFLNGTVIYDSTQAQRYTSMKDIAIPFSPLHQAYACYFRPLLNEVSVPTNANYASLEAYIIDGQTSSKSNIGKLSIVVQKVIKPPKPVQGLSTLASTRSLVVLTSSWGTASVTTRPITNVFLHSYPSNGILYVVRSWDNSIIRTISKVQQQLSSDWVVGIANGEKLAYRSNSSELLLSPGTLSIANDTFQFGVIDNAGLKSITAVFNIYLEPSIKGEVKQLMMLETTNKMIIPMQIKDSSNDARDLSIFLNQSPSRGKLVCGLQYCTSDQMLLKSLKPIQYKKGANLTYIRTDTINQHFSLPNVDWLGNPLVNPAEQISTKIYLNDNTYVADAIYSIDIINVNDASDISISWKTIPPIYAYGSNTKKNEALSYFILSDITINDPDQGVDLVRISISTTNRGMIMLNNSLPFNYYKSSVFLSSTDIYCKSANWSCEGEYETAARRFSFVSTVSAALALLNGAKYYSLRGNIDDTITIAVYDGVGKDCLTAVAHGSANPTIRQGCFTSSLSLNIRVNDYVGIDENSSSSTASKQLAVRLQYILLAAIILIFLVIIRWCCCSKKTTKDKSKHYHDEDKPTLSSHGGGTCPNTPIREKVIISIVDVNHPDDEFHGISPYHTPKHKNIILSTPPSSSHKNRQSMAKIQMGRSPSSTTSSRQKDREVHHSPSSSWRKKRDVTTDYIYQTPPKRMLKSSRKHPVSTSGKLGRTRDDNHLPHVDDRSEWSIHRHESGRVFYYNTRTKASTWRKPKSLSA